MTDNKIATDIKLDHSWNVEWYVSYYPGMKDQWKVGKHGQRYTKRNLLAKRLRMLYGDEHIRDIVVVEHNVLSKDELDLLMRQEE